MMQASKNGYVDALCVLIVAGADLNDSDNDGRTSVFWATARDKAECLLALVRMLSLVRGSACPIDACL